MDSFIWMNAFVCTAAGRPRLASIAVVITFPDMPLVITAQPGSKSWSMVHTDLNLSTNLPFNGRLYGMTQGNNQLVQVYPGTNNPASLAAAAAVIVVAQVPNGISNHLSNCVYYLVETMASMLLVVLHKNANKSATGFTLLAVDLRCGKLTPVTGLGGDKALFLGHDRCVSVSSKNLPSIVGNTIHFTMPGRNPKLATQCQLHNGVRPIRQPVRPYALADHLITNCHHREWTRGLMFHEFYYVPASWN
uniref:KIB1-4 beta-propeller domain-containing protein n=1 Tax=Oryza punctata TaxID=4537 RepID=A0A0E0M365_ORYPU